MDPATPRQPLDGVRVLDCGTVYAAPITAMLLADFGADVVKVEHPRGRPGPHPRLERGRARPVVEGHLPQQALRHPEHRQAGGPGGPATWLAATPTC